MLGLALALVAFPGLLVSYAGAWTGALFVLATLAALGGWARWRRSVPLLAAGRWLTERPLAGAQAGREAFDAARLRRRLVLETGLWILLVCGWVILARRSGLLVFGTGLASAAFGAVQVGPARTRVAREQSRRGETFVVARRPGLGTPDLGIAPALPSTR